MVVSDDSEMLTI